MKIAITAPTGNIGRRLVQQLLEVERHTVALLARKPEKLADAQAGGAIVVQGDVADGDSMKELTEGAEALFLLIPPSYAAPDIRAYQHQVAETAGEAVRSNGVERVVLLSSIGAHLGQGVGPINGLHDAEKIIGAAAPTAVFLRPAFFMENFLMALAGIAQAQSIFMPLSGQVRVPMIATMDIAPVAVKELVEPRPQGIRVVPLHGPRDYSFDEAAGIIGQALGREVKHIRISPDQAREFMTGAGLTDHVADVMLEMYAAMESGALQAEFPRSEESTTPTTLEQFAQQVLAPAVQAADSRES